MATVAEVVYTDDLTGEQLAENAFRTVHLAVDGRAYELHLSGASSAALEEALRPFIADAVGAKVKPPTGVHRISVGSRRGPARVDREPE